MDADSGYDKLGKGIRIVACWAHALRNFTDALKALPRYHTPMSSAAEQGLSYCKQLFAKERELKNLSPEERFRGRGTVQSTSLHPGSHAEAAVRYCLNLWDNLLGYLEDSRLEIDNNRSERSIKTFVIGRKNWLFACTPNGAEASAIYYSMIETAKENGLNAYDYLKNEFDMLATLKTWYENALLELMPWSDSMQSICRKMA